MENDVNRVALVGCGKWGKNLARNFAALGALAAVVDNDESAAKAIATEHGVPAQTLSSILDDVSINAVAIATPPVDHFTTAQAALLAKKHVFVEKPLALDVAEGQKLCAISEQTNQVLMVGHLLHYHPAFQKLQELIHAGELGRVQYLYSHRLNLGMVRQEENILWSFAPHDISMILSLVGTRAKVLHTVGAGYLNKKVADVTTTHLSFPGGEQAHIFVSWLNPFKEHRLVVIGEAGMAVFDDSEPWETKLTIFPQPMEWVEGRPVPNRGDGVHMELCRTEPLAAECNHFLDCCRGLSTPRTDGREAMEVLRVLQESQQILLGLSRGHD